MTSDLLCCQLLEVANREVRQKGQDGSQKVWWPRRDVAHHTWLQESLYKSFFLRQLHPWAVVSNGGQPAEQRLAVSAAKCLQCRSSRDLHAVVDYQRGGEAHDIRDRHEGDEVREVDKQLRGHSGELMEESSGHCLHGLQLSLGGLTVETKAQEKSWCAFRFTCFKYAWSMTSVAE